MSRNCCSLWPMPYANSSPGRGSCKLISWFLNQNHSQLRPSLSHVFYASINSLLVFQFFSIKRGRQKQRRNTSLNQRLTWFNFIHTISKCKYHMLRFCCCGYYIKLAKLFQNPPSTRIQSTFCAPLQFHFTWFTSTCKVHVFVHSRYT